MTSGDLRTVRRITVSTAKRRRASSHNQRPPLASSSRFTTSIARGAGRCQRAWCRQARGARRQPGGVRRLLAYGQRPCPQGSPSRPGRHPVDVRTRPQYGAAVARARVGGNVERGGHRDWRERHRLLRIPRLPSRIHRRVRRARDAGDRDRRWRYAVPHPRAPPTPDEGGDYPQRHGVGAGLRTDAQLLRPGSRRAALRTM